MDLRAEIATLEHRLADAGQSVARLCREAGINQTTWVRWKNGTPARKGTWDQVTKAASSLLDGPEGERAA